MQDTIGQREAAARLGISVRSLQRLVKAGRLEVRYAPGKTRSVPVFATSEIDALHTLLSARPVYPQSRNGQEPKLPFGFRLAPQEREALVLDAQRCGMHTGEYVRYLVQMSRGNGLEKEVSALRGELSSLHAQVLRLEKALHILQKDFPAAIEVVLEYSGMSRREAQGWVTSNLQTEAGSKRRAVRKEAERDLSG